mmetsp:Transcript_8422/g.26118  ORF Transcript_8422/g.26118 Transcript_8422/m.26118 type:complete len:229 (+) Transcript_8422:1081-1767(+)
MGKTRYAHDRQGPRRQKGDDISACDCCGHGDALGWTRGMRLRQPEAGAGRAWLSKDVSPSPLLRRSESRSPRLSRSSCSRRSSCMNCSIWDGPFSLPFLPRAEGLPPETPPLAMTSPSTSSASSAVPPKAFRAAGVRLIGAEMRGPGRPAGSPARTKRLGLSAAPSNSSINRACSAARASSCSFLLAASSSFRFSKALFFVAPRLKEASLSEVIERMAPGWMEPGANP